MEYSTGNPRIANINYLAPDTCQLLEILLDFGLGFGSCLGRGTDGPIP